MVIAAGLIMISGIRGEVTEELEEKEAQGEGVGKAKELTQPRVEEPAKSKETKKRR